MREQSDTEHSDLAPESTAEPEPRTVVRAAAPPPAREFEAKPNPTLGDVYDLLRQNRIDEQDNRRKQLELYGQVRGDLDAARGEVRSLRQRIEVIDKRLEEGEIRFGRIETSHVEALDRVTVVLGKLQMRFTDPSEELLNTTVLIVEDDAPVQRLITQICKRAGATTIAVATVEEARSELTTMKTPAAATVDVLLGAGGDGLALVRELATQRRDIGVVIVTGGLTERQRREAEALGVACLGKPFDSDSLVAALAAARNAARH